MLSISIRLIKKALRHYINYLPQQPYVFNGTILDNLLWGAKEDNTGRYLAGSRIGRIREDIRHATELSDRIDPDGQDFRSTSENRFGACSLDELRQS